MLNFKIIQRIENNNNTNNEKKTKEVTNNNKSMYILFAKKLCYRHSVMVLMHDDTAWFVHSIKKVKQK